MLLVAFYMLQKCFLLLSRFIWCYKCVISIFFTKIKNITATPIPQGANFRSAARLAACNTATTRSIRKAWETGYFRLSAFPNAFDTSNKQHLNPPNRRGDSMIAQVQ